MSLQIIVDGQVFPSMAETLPAIIEKLDVLNSHLVGVTGCAGSGKTTMAKELADYLSRQGHPIIHIDADLYLRYPREEKMRRVRLMGSIEDYWAVYDIKNLEEDLKRIRTRTPFRRESMYCRQTGSLDDSLQIEFSSGEEIFIIDGMQLCHPRLFHYFDKLLLIDTDVDLCLARKVTRANYRSPEETVALFRRYEEPLFNMCKEIVIKTSNPVIITETITS